MEYHCYIECKYCNEIKTVTRETIGVICNKCKKYITIKPEDRLTLEQAIEKDKEFINNNVFHIPNVEFVKYRNKMESHAYDWAKKQREKPKLYHGPINPDTGEHEL